MKRFFFCFWFHVPLTTISKFVLIHLLSLETARASENKRNKSKVEYFFNIREAIFIPSSFLKSILASKLKLLFN